MFLTTCPVRFPVPAGCPYAPVPSGPAENSAPLYTVFRERASTCPLGTHRPLFDLR
jgi:hypothetical protein